MIKVQALLGIADASLSDSKHETMQRVHSIIAQLRKEAKSSLSVLLLSLEIQLSQTNCNVDVALGDLMEIVRTAHILEGNHNLILHYTRRLWAFSPGPSADCFRFYLIHRLLPQDDPELFERAIINYLEFYLEHDSTSTSEGLRQLEADFSSFKDLTNGSLSSIAAQAAHIILWKKIIDIESEVSQSIAMLLCQVALHPLLSAATEASSARFERQLICYHLLVANHAVASEMLDKMTLKQKNNKHSRYLSYCLAARSGNEADVQSHLNAILNGSGENDQLLYACLGESMKHNRDHDTIRLLQRLIDQQARASPAPEIRNLLKFAVTMLMKVCDCQQLDSATRNELQGRLCAVFESTTQFQERLRKESRIVSRSRTSDWRWFSEKSFDFARRQIKTWPQKHIIDLLHYSNQILRAEMGGFAEAILSDSERQRLFDCNFMQIILYVAESRIVNDKYSIEDLPRTSYISRSRLGSSDYRHVLHKQVFDKYSALLKDQQATIEIDKGENQETLAQLHVLMPLAFEALIYMSANSYVSSETMFDETSSQQFLQEASELEATSVTFALLADIVLTFASGDAEARSRCNNLRIPSLVAARLLGQIVETLRESKSYDLDQAARWIRCVVQLVLDDIDKVLKSAKANNSGKLKSEHSLTLLESLVEQVCELALSVPNDMISDDFETSVYPSDELQWLASKLFNLSVDLYILEKTDLAQNWGSKALKVAKVMYKLCGTIAASDLTVLLEQKVTAMNLAVRSD